MAIERRNPLPPGLYWVDVFGKHWAQFSDWLARHKGQVRVVRVQEFEAIQASAGPGHKPLNQPARRWYLFEVLKPVLWEGPGLPTIENDPDTTSEDTQTVPEIQHPIEEALEGLGEDVMKGASSGFETVARWGVIGLLIYGGYKIATMPRRGRA